MAQKQSASAGLETYAWTALVATVALVPMAVTKFPGSAVPLTFSAFGYPQTVVLMVGVGVTLALWAAALVRGQSDVALSRSMIPLAALVGWSAVATTAAMSPMRSLLGRSSSSLSMVQILAYAAVFFLALQLMRSATRMRTLSWAVVGSAAFVAALGLLQQLFGASVFGLVEIEEWMTGRGFSTMGNPDHLGTFLVLPLLLAAFLFLAEDDARERTVAGVSTGLLATVLIGTLTRGAWIASAAGLLVIVALVRVPARSRERGRLLALLGVIVAAGIVAVLASDSVDLASRFAQSPPPGEVSSASTLNAVSSERINVWRSVIGIAAERPLTGTGPGAFELGWYRHAVRPASVAGEVAVADDTHSLPMYVLATTGIPGLLAYLALVVWTLWFGLRTSLSLVRDTRPRRASLHYVGWFVAATALQIALLLAAVSTPILLYAFLSLAVLLRPTARVGESTAAARGTLAIAAASGLAALALVATPFPSLRAESAVRRVADGTDPAAIRPVIRAAFWNLDVQEEYFGLRVSEVEQLLTTENPAAPDAVTVITDELRQAAAQDPREFYYLAVRSKVLTAASSEIGAASYGEAAVQAADEALAIMPESLPVRVQKALALARLERFDDMAETLRHQWEYETVSAYPGILYAQALAYSGKTAEANAVFGQLHVRFPGEGDAIESARAQTQESATP